MKVTRSIPGIAGAGEQGDKAADDAELMYIKCAACGKWMDVKPGAINRVSHTVCPECFEREMAKLETGQPPP